MRAAARARRACAGGAHELRGAAGARPLMAKRRAEPLMCHVPVKRLLREPALPRAGERRPRAELGSTGPAALKRPLEEAEAPPGKRLGPGAPRAQPGDASGGRRGGTVAPQDAPAVEGRAGGRGKEQPAAAAEAREVSSSITGSFPAPCYGTACPPYLRLCSASSPSSSAVEACRIYSGVASVV
ncbi:uncharacterized protein C9orf40 homolog isoform X2 [Haemorhous mexicanus]|uniref:uncharacterized protein C9orf40 homolog isoform X2 n=1 Tax=Haemorhous mexicanus TaxID=30427 RepID=UPI0028BF28AB|nr:uncharacterized protein C9orf40 homolog isoform X2 [Haemorhous mexicanus]